MKKYRLMSIAILCGFLTACSSGSGSGGAGDPTESNATNNGEKRTILIPGAVTVGDLNQAAEMEKLLATIKTQDNLRGCTR